MSMRMWLARANNTLIATDEDSAKIIRRLEEGECAVFRMVRPRSLRWHRMYFAICREIGRNQDPPRDEDSIDYELRILAGHYEVMYLGKHPGADFLASVCERISRLLPEKTVSRFEALVIQLQRGYEIRVPKRIAFDQLTADEWAELWPSLEQAMSERFGIEPRHIEVAA